MEFNFKYSLTEDDYAEYAAFTNWYAPWQKKERIKHAIKTFIYSSIFFIATIILLDRINSSGEDNYIVLIPISIVILLLLTILEFYQAPFRLKSKARKHVRKEENVQVLNETELFFDDSGIINNDKDVKVNLKWESIKKYAQTKGYFYVYLSSLQALVIPKRLFISNISIESFDKFLTEKIPLSASFRSIGI